MASEIEFTSDSDDVCVTDVPECHKIFMKAKLIDYLSDVNDYSVKIIHTHNKEAQMVFRFGSKQGK